MAREGNTVRVHDALSPTLSSGVRGARRWDKYWGLHHPYVTLNILCKAESREAATVERPLRLNRKPNLTKGRRTGNNFRRAAVAGGTTEW